MDCYSFVSVLSSFMSFCDSLCYDGLFDTELFKNVLEIFLIEFLHRSCSSLILFLDYKCENYVM